MKTLNRKRFIPLLLTPLLVVMMVVPTTLVLAKNESELSKRERRLK